MSFIMTCGIFGWYYYAQHAIIPTYQKDLTEIAQTRFDEILAYLTEQEKYAIQLSQELMMIDPQKQHSSKKIAQTINSHKETMGFKNILLVDKHGKILFSTTKNNLIGTNLTERKNSSLGKSYERATMTLTNDFSNFNFNELLQEPALFITIPMLHNKKYIGVLSYQLDEEKIYHIAHQYIGLGKTGEVVLACKDGQFTVFVAPTRNDPDLAFKKRTLFTNPPLASQASVLGEESAGTAIDYRGKKIIGSWKYIPKLDWGMIVKIDLDEAVKPLFILFKICLFFLLIFMISALLTMYFFRREIHSAIISTEFFRKIPALLKNPFFILFLIFGVFTIKNIFYCQRKKSAAIEKAQHQAQEINEKNSDNMSKLLEKIEFVGQTITQDLHTNYLKKDDILTRIKRDLAENSMITDITVAYTSDNKTTLHVETTSPDTTIKKQVPKTNWFIQAQEKENIWIIDTPKNNTEPTGTYALNFLDNTNKIQGVVAITFSLNIIINSIESSTIGQTGYSFITTQNGTFIFHPIASLVEKQITLLQFAQSQGNEELARIAQEALNNKKLIASYLSTATHEQYWIMTQTISPNNWIIGTVFSESEIGLTAQKIRHYYFWILLWLTITLLLFVSLLYSLTRISETMYAALINSVLLLGLMAVWYAITITHTINRESIAIITDESSLDKFLNDLNEEAARKHEPKPINIPCGLLINALNITDSDHIEISGYLWSKYNTEQHKDVTRGIDILHAIRMAIGKPVTSINNGIETETWTVQGPLSQEQQNNLYPFDQQQLRIALEHRDIEKNIILTPDLTGYKKISPESTPGLDKSFSIAGFTVEQAFFEYKHFDPKSNFGLKEYGKVTDHFQLIYNVILNRNLLNPFVLYILPLLVILFSLFCTLLLAGKKTDPFSVLGPYTGLFFSLIVLQRSLREQHPSGSTLYMEYAFFYTYVTIILLILHAILNHFYKHKSAYQDKILHLMKLLFWPFQFITWLITTLIVFY